MPGIELNLFMTYLRPSTYLLTNFRGKHDYYPHVRLLGVIGLQPQSTHTASTRDEGIKAHAPPVRTAHAFPHSSPPAPLMN